MDLLVPLFGMIVTLSTITIGICIIFYDFVRNKRVWTYVFISLLISFIGSLILRILTDQPGWYVAYAISLLSLIMCSRFKKEIEKKK